MILIYFSDYCLWFRIKVQIVDRQSADENVEPIIGNLKFVLKKVVGFMVAVALKLMKSVSVHSSRLPTKSIQFS